MHTYTHCTPTHTTLGYVGNVMVPCRPAAGEADAGIDAAEVAERIRGFVDAMSGLEGAEVRVTLCSL